MTEKAVVTVSEGQVIEAISSAELAPVEMLPIDRNPAAVYLAGLTSQTSKRTMRDALNRIATLVWGIDTRAAVSKKQRDQLQQLYLSFPWAELRFQHTSAIRAQLAETHAAATANKMLSALRGVLKAAWRLDQLPSDEYQRAVDLDGIIGETA